MLQISFYYHYITESIEHEICSFEHEFGFYLLSCSFLSKITFFGDIYVNLPVLLVKNNIFVEISFSKVNSVFDW